MNDRAPTEKRSIPNQNVASQQYCVGDHDPVADTAIVGHMAGGHQEAVRADFRRRTILGGAINRHVLANDGARAYPHPGLCVRIEAHILRIAADHGKRMHDHPLTELAVPAYHCMSMDYAAGTESRTLLDEGGRMYLHGRQFRLPVPCGCA